MNIKHRHSLKNNCKSEYYRSKSVKSFLAVIISVIAIISIYKINAYFPQTGPVGPSVKTAELITPITLITQSTPHFPDLTPLPRLISVKSAELMIVRPHDDDVSPRQREKNVISD